MMRIARKFLQDREGAAVIEYALIGTLISVALLGGFNLYANAMKNTYSTMANTALGNGTLGSP